MLIRDVWYKGRMDIRDVWYKGRMDIRDVGDVCL